MSILMAILVMGLPALMGVGYAAGCLKLRRQEDTFRAHARLG